MFSTQSKVGNMTFTDELHKAKFVDGHHLVVIGRLELCECIKVFRSIFCSVEYYSIGMHSTLISTLFLRTLYEASSPQYIRLQPM